MSLIENMSELQTGPRGNSDDQQAFTAKQIKKGEAVASPLFGAVKLLVNSWPAISETSAFLIFEQQSIACTRKSIQTECAEG